MRIKFYSLEYAPEISLTTGRQLTQIQRCSSRLRICILLTQVSFEKQKLYRLGEYELCSCAVCLRCLDPGRIKWEMVSPSRREGVPYSRHLQAIMRVWRKLVDESALCLECAQMNGSKWQSPGTDPGAHTLLLTLPSRWQQTSNRTCTCSEVGPVLCALYILLAHLSPTRSLKGQYPQYVHLPGGQLQAQRGKATCQGSTAPGVRVRQPAPGLLTSVLG